MSPESVTRVAFATDNGLEVNQHFGSCRRFDFYTVSPEAVMRQGESGFPPTREDGNEDKLDVRLAALSGCGLIFCAAVGGGAVRQLLQAGVKPVLVPTGSAIPVLLEEVRRGVHFPATRGWCPTPGGETRVRALLEESWDDS